MTEERKHAILFAATLLCARKLSNTGDPSPLVRPRGGWQVH
jgi:hypothetical protein